MIEVHVWLWLLMAMDHLWVFLLVNGLDIATTHYVVKRRGLAGEGNPVMRGVMHVLGPSKAMWVMKAVLLAYVVTSEAQFAFAQANLIIGVVVLWNFVQIARMRRDNNG